MDGGNPSAAGGSGWIGRRYLHLVTGAFFLLTGCIYLYQTFKIRVPPLGDALGPRLFPLALGSLLTFFSIVFLVSEIIGKPEHDDAADLPAQRGAWLVFGLLMLFTLVFDRIGYLLGTMAFVFVILSALKFRGIVINLLSALTMSGVFFLVFRMWLGVPLPGLQF